MIRWLMNTELERMWKELIMAYFEVLSQQLPKQTEKTHENPHSW
jgi:hypothetical protein